MVPEQLVSPARVESDGAITKFAAEFPKTEPSFLDPGKSGILAFPGDVGKEFAGAPETGEAGIPHACAIRERTGLQDKDMMMGMPAFVMQGSEEPDKPAADHGQVGFGMETAGGPEAVHHRSGGEVRDPSSAGRSGSPYFAKLKGA